MRNKAFTLIELLVVITIIGLLSIVATTSFLTAQRNGRDNARKTSLNALAVGLETYKSTNGKYPGITNPSSYTSSGKTLETWVGNLCIINETYYYNPNGKCSDSATNTIDPSTTDPILAAHTPSAYSPEPNWIPGMGQYLNPPIIERRYSGANGDLGAATFVTTSGKPYFDTTKTATSNNRTVAYKRTNTGYNVYTVLENLDDFAHGGNIYGLSK